MNKLQGSRTQKVMGRVKVDPELHQGRGTPKTFLVDDFFFSEKFLFPWGFSMERFLLSLFPEFMGQRERRNTKNSKTLCSRIDYLFRAKCILNIDAESDPFNGKKFSTQKKYFQHFLSLNFFSQRLNIFIRKTLNFCAHYSLPAKSSSSE